MSISKIKTTYTRRQTERALLGAALVAAEILDHPEVARLDAEHFSVRGHREIWRAVRGLRAQAHAITPATVHDALERADAADLAELLGLSTEPDLASALRSLQEAGEPDRAIEHAVAAREMGENLKLVEELDELSDAAKVWPPTPRAFFCEAFETLAGEWCAARTVAT